MRKYKQNAKHNKNVNVIKCKGDEYLITLSKDSPGAKTLKPFDQNANVTKCKCDKIQKATANRNIMWFTVANHTI